MTHPASRYRPGTAAGPYRLPGGVLVQLEPGESPTEDHEPVCFWCQESRQGLRPCHQRGGALFECRLCRWFRTVMWLPFAIHDWLTNNPGDDDDLRP